MDHRQAIQIHAAERYLLEELSPDERDGFEAHYFDCPQCAEEVRSAFTFADNSRAVMKDWPKLVVKDRPSARSAGWWAWFQNSMAIPAAAVLLLGITLYQSLLVIPRLERNLQSTTAPRIVPSTVASAATRGETPVVQLASDDPFVQVILDIDTSMTASSYVCEIHDDSGALLFSMPTPAPSVGSSLNLLLPATKLKAGRHTIKIRSGNSEATYYFVVQGK